MLPRNQRPMLPWASPLEGLSPQRRGHRRSHRSVRLRVFSVLCAGAEAPARCCGFPGCWCSRGPKPAALASQLGLRVRAPLTGPPSWLALVPGGLPRWRSSAADPTGTCSRGSAGPEGLAPGATSSGLSSLQSLDDSCRAFSDPAVRARGRAQLDRSCPRDIPGSHVVGPRASVAGASVSRFVSGGCSPPGRVASVGRRVGASGKAMSRGAQPRSVTVRPVPEFPAAGPSVPEGASGSWLPASRPKPVRGGTPCRPRCRSRSGRGREAAGRVAPRSRLRFQRLDPRGIAGGGREDLKARRWSYRRSQCCITRG